MSIVFGRDNWPHVKQLLELYNLTTEEVEIEVRKYTIRIIIRHDALTKDTYQNITALAI